MRKFFLRLIEWHDGQRALDMRAYKSMCVHMKDPPEPGLIFPSLRTDGSSASDDVDPDDDTVFQQVAASLSAFGK